MSTHDASNYRNDRQIDRQTDRQKEQWRRVYRKPKARIKNKSVRLAQGLLLYSVLTHVNKRVAASAAYSSLRKRFLSDDNSSASITRIRTPQISAPCNVSMAVLQLSSVAYLA